MDWARARMILLVAFTAVNLSLAYLIWGGTARGLLTDRGTSRGERDRVLIDLATRGVQLDPAVILPPTPQPMSFLRVVHQPAALAGETIDSSLVTLDGQTGLLTVRPSGKGSAARELKLENRNQAQQFATEYGRSINLLPPEAQVSGIYVQPRSGFLRVEYTPVWNGLPVFAGYVWIDLSTRGVETITRFWVVPEGPKEGASKAVRPAQEALLRVADQLQSNASNERTITEVRLGYYAGPSIAGAPSSLIRAWDTVPVWQVRVGDTQVYYVNAFNGQLES
jgi:hypothetical protein